MIAPSLENIARVAGGLLLASSIVIFPGLMMFWRRAGHRGGKPASQAYYVWERSFIMSGAIIAAIGFVLLEGVFQNTDGLVLARIGATAYFIAGILGAIGEALSPKLGYDNLHSVIVVYVVLAYLGQAAIGGALLQAGILAIWIGWLTIIWNIAWLIVLPLITPRDIYFPVLHHFMPLIIGIALVWH